MSSAVICWNVTVLVNKATLIEKQHYLPCEGGCFALSFLYQSVEINRRINLFSWGI